MREGSERLTFQTLPSSSPMKSQPHAFRVHLTMDARDLRAALDELSLPDGEAARLLYITPNALWQYLQGKRKIPGPMVAAIEAWQRHGVPPGATTAKETMEPGK